MVMILTLTMVLGCFGTGGKVGVPGVSNAKELNTATDAELTTAPDSELSVTETGETEGESFSYEDTYNSENFDVNFKLDNVWDTGYNATITITNTSDSVIENWCLTFPLNENIADIWNASISETHEDFYVIKTAGWNQDIAAGQSVSFGITVYEPFTDYPEYYTILGNEVETKSEDYTVDYKITEDWGEGYKAEVTITNNKNVAIEDWRLTFEYGDNIITQIWNAVIVSNIDGKYELSCESYNQNIAPKGSVTFGFMVEPGCSGKLIENVVLKEYVAAVDNTENNPPETEEDMDDVEKIALIFGEINDENNSEIYLDMMANVEISSYDIYMSFDKGDFEKVGATEDYQYIYSITNGCSSIEIYAIGYDLNNVAVESNHIYVQCKDGVYSTVLPDTDCDGLEDVYEIYYGSDVNLEDSDEDGLGDYYEVYASSTYPGLADSDDNKIMDGDEDYDGDGLSTLEECNKGTDPLNPDTDYDNLSDGEEVNVYDTAPVVADWDGDGLVDGDEIALGTDPQLYDTDEDGLKDGDEKFKQTYAHQVENQESPVTEVSVTLEGTGNLETTTYIESVMNKDALCTGVVGLVGEPFSIETTSEFESATITFKVDKELLGDNSFDSLMFLWYDEENQNFVELDTVLDETTGCVSVETTHFSKYMLVNSIKWKSAWLTELNYNVDVTDKENYTIMAMECSSEISQYDPILSNSVFGSHNRVKSCYRIKAAEKLINNMSDNDAVSIMYCSNRYSTWTQLRGKEYKQELLDMTQRIWNGGQPSYSSALSSCYYTFEKADVIDSPANKKVIFTVTGDKKGYLGSCTEDFVEANIVLDVVLVGNQPISEQLEEMCLATGGQIHRADTTEHLEEVYDYIFTYDSLDKTDADGDGLYDVVETAGIRLANGQIIYTKVGDNDSDDDGLLDGEEVNPVPVYLNKKITVSGIPISVKGWVFLLNSDPNNPDTDGDGISDINDNCPLIRGVYSIKSKDIVVGEMTIVSSTYNSIGHSFLVYRSYIFDALDFSEFEKGYCIDMSGNSFFSTEADTYFVGNNDYVTIGASGADIGEFRFTAYELFDCDTAGVFYNREFAVEINEGKNVYINNAAYSREVTEEQLNIILDIHREHNRYKVLTENCAYIASKSWNRAFKSGKISIVDRPRELKKLILNMNGSYEIKLRKLIGIE